MDIWFILFIFFGIPLIGYVITMATLVLALFLEYMEKMGQKLTDEKYKKGEKFNPLLNEITLYYIQCFMFGFVVILILSWSLTDDPFYYFRYIYLK
tara:strand:+ start:103 stop:390 length:288 start_codon:yes stop_codon:yes gene_type:complete